MSIRSFFAESIVAGAAALVLLLGSTPGCTKSGGAPEAPGAATPAPGETATPAPGETAAPPAPAADAGDATPPAADAGAPSEAPGGELGPLVDCDTSKVRCRRMPPQCAEGEAPTVEGSCFGGCVKIERCACSATVKCPNVDKYTCWSNKHCGPYVR